MLIKQALGPKNKKPLAAKAKNNKSEQVLDCIEGRDSALRCPLVAVRKDCGNTIAGALQEGCSGGAVTEISFSSIALPLSCCALIQRINGRSAH
jgi:hypothetical protein